MTEPLPQVWLVRHGETAWTVTGQHTGRTDIPLSERGEREALAVGARLRGRGFAGVFVSPLQRARRTCELAGFMDVAAVDDDLVEWGYGEYEGRTAAEIRGERPGWDLFRDGCPGGEAMTDIAARAERVVARLRALGGDALLFAHGHFLRFLTARWLDLPPEHARSFQITTASLSILGYEHGPHRPVIRLWNDLSHLQFEHH